MQKIGSEDTDFDVFIRGMQLTSYDEIITPYDRNNLLFLSKDQIMNYLLWGTHIFFTTRCYCSDTINRSNCTI